MKYYDIRPKTFTDKLFDLGWTKCKPNYFSYNFLWNLGIMFHLHIKGDFPQNAPSYHYEYPLDIYITRDQVDGYKRVFEGRVYSEEQLKEILLSVIPKNV